jgi:hypothetical protein
MRAGFSIGIAIFAACLTSVSAQACRGMTLERSILFDDVTGLDAPVIARVTVTAMLNQEQPKPGVRVPDDQYVQRFTLVGLARVEQVIKGELAGSLIKVAVLPTSCGPYFGAGVSGTVAGTIKHDTQGTQVLHLISESPSGRDRRLRNTGRL